MKKHSINEIINCQTLKQVRKDILNKTLNPLCKDCVALESKGLSTNIKTENDIFEDLFTIKDAISITDSNSGEITQELPPMALSLHLGNICNLKCIMCNPSNSNSWVTSYQKILPSDDCLKHFDNSKYNWPLKDISWNNIKSNFLNLKYIHFAGGDPLLVKQHFTLLDELISKKLADQIMLFYQTNLTSIPKGLEKRWPHFKCIRIGLSIEGVSKVNNYIRYPSNFDTIISNLNVLKKNHSNLEINFKITLQALSIYYLPDFFNWYWNRIKTRNNPEGFSIMLLEEPSYFSIQILPTHIKQYITNHFNHIIKNIRINTNNAPIFNKIEHCLKKIILHMNELDQSSQFGIFKTTITSLDKHRNTSLKKEMPEFYNLLNQRK